MNKPILKWAGGKSDLLPLIREKVLSIDKKDFSQQFFDVFGGGASVTLEFHRDFKMVYFNDTNSELIELYKVVKDKPKELMVILKFHQENHSKDYYYNIRSLDRDEKYNNLSSLERSARMLYLNKTCYNGLYRVNLKGQFNVPIGRPMNRKIFEHDNLMNFHKAFQNVNITNDDYSLVIKKAKTGDIVYLDPPYDKVNESSFIAYNGKLFDSFDQKRLASDVDDLTEKGVFVIFSNSNTENIRSLYKEYLSGNPYINARRKISSKSNGRILETEILGDNFLKVKK